MMRKHRYRVPNRSEKTIPGQRSQTCLYGHSLNQSLVAHAESATDSDQNLDAAVMYKVLSIALEHVGQIQGLGIQNYVVPGLSRDAS
eukprot:6209167-Pleurochrysis_carterae.AAC.1